jgi:hypothetical protein
MPAQAPVTSSPKSRRRQSAPPLIQRATDQHMPTQPDASSLSEEGMFPRSRHVYFLEPNPVDAEDDSNTNPLTREAQSIAKSSTQPQPIIDTSPPSSISSSSVHDTSNQIHVQLDSCDDRSVESDSSSRRSSLPMRLPRMKNPFVGKARRIPRSNTDPVVVPGERFYVWLSLLLLI